MTMAALFLTLLLAVIAIAAVSALADSGLRWWSAFGRLRADLAMRIEAQLELPSRRAAVSYSGFNRGRMPRKTPRQTISRAAA